MPSYPLVIGHRGAMGEAPENTLKSFNLALKQGADGIELDVFLTRDGQVVVTHDNSLKRLAGVKGHVRKSTLRELKNLDFGEGEEIPTLKEVFDHFGSRFSLINVEIKSTGFLSDGIEQALLKIINNFNLSSRVLVSSFNVLNLMRLKRLNPAINVAYLSCAENWYIPPALGVPLSCAVGVNLDYRALTPEIMQYYLSQKKQIWVWTVNSRQDMELFINKPVAAIITNYPGRLKKLIQENYETRK